MIPKVLMSFFVKTHSSREALPRVWDQLVSKTNKIEKKNRRDADDPTREAEPRANHTYFFQRKINT